MWLFVALCHVRENDVGLGFQLLLHFTKWANFIVLLMSTVEFFVFNTNLTFMYKIDIEGFKKF